MLKELRKWTFTLVFAGLVVILGGWSWHLRAGLLGSELEAARLREQTQQLQVEVNELQEESERLAHEAAEALRRVDELEVARALLKTNHRLARIDVLGTSRLDPTETHLRFVELDEDGEQLGDGQTFSVHGRLVYLEALVIKFADDFIEGGDALRGTSVCLFKRVFGEDTAPSAGFALDSPNARPAAFADDSLPEPLFTELWARFWDYANDSDLAALHGVRAIHGEAPFMEMRPGQSYAIELRASGGLSIRPLK
ncbi:MAG: hypothetical protein QF724_04945 [Planctomycetota bacterium]|nr:hypothetical protein [Planctomycetota bacterium]MDP6518490.1 hypothetical protein [Planctomycetota bacterium]MDP6838265.1 hypothetical protein [Planctomycetota bacterium]MDP6954443.1 hypothetical protein [Planctomycetota bacterium]